MYVIVGLARRRGPSLARLKLRFLGDPAGQPAGSTVKPGCSKSATSKLARRLVWQVKQFWALNCFTRSEDN